MYRLVPEVQYLNKAFYFQASKKRSCLRNVSSFNIEIANVMQNSKFFNITRNYF